MRVPELPDLLANSVAFDRLMTEYIFFANSIGCEATADEMICTPEQLAQLDRWLKDNMDRFVKQWFEEEQGLDDE